MREPDPATLPPHGDPESRTRSIGRLALPLGIAAVLLPTVFAGGVVASKGLPEVTVQAADLPHQMIAVGWPAGRGPILVGQQAIEDCIDDRCRTVRRTKLSVLMYEPYGGAAFGPDGSVFALGQHELEQCDAQRVCRRREGGLPALEESGAAAIALSPAGEILIASATEVRPTESADRAAAPEEPRHVELKLVRCPDVFCVDPAVTSFGLVDGSLQQRGDRSRSTKLMVRTDGRGRPVVAFRSPFTGMVSVGWCMTPDCDRADVASFGGSRRSAMPTNEELALLDFDGIFDCLGEDDCGGGEAVATVHGPHGAVYDVVIEHGYPNGFHVQVGGSAPPPGRAVLRICTDRVCGDPKRIPLVQVPPVYAHWTDRPAHERWLIAVAPDGRMVATDQFANQTVVVRP